MNSVNLVGNISSDVDLRATPAGKFVAKFNIAVNNPYNREKTSFLPIEVWGTTAQNTANFCGKGSKISVVGYIDVESWEKEGKKNYKTKIVADKIGFLDSKAKESKEQTPRYTADPGDPFKKNGTEVEIDDSEFPF